MSMLYIDVAQVLSGDYSPPEPDILPLSDGGYLFYSGEFNLVHGDTESGKTWLCLAAVADVLNNGGRAAIIDLDHNGARSLLSRLIAFGVPVETLIDPNRFRLAEPGDSLDLKGVVTDLTAFTPDVVTIDSLGEVLPLFKFNSNNADDFTVAHTEVIKPLTRCGACVLVVDHLAKGADSRSFGPTGTAAKSRAVGGSSIRVTAEVPFRPGEGGKAKLELFKDRHGGVRRQFPQSDPKPVVGTFVLTPEGGDNLSYSIEHGLTVPLSKQRDINDHQAAEDAARLTELGDINVSVRSVRALLNCGQPRAERAISAYRAAGTPDTNLQAA
ncbi:MAG: Bifunctional primase/polymerase famiily protein [Mycobacterium sp.]|nr:Bifunctional primase/polymerase famiily protein [Mycobacterium sp.]